MTALTLLQLILAACGLLVSVLALVAVVHFLLRLERPRSRKTCRATLILPLTGTAPTLERLVEAIAGQTLPARRLLIAVENERDPAYARAVSMIGTRPLDIEVVVAGQARHTAQKCQNQIAALNRIDAGDDAVVLLDADIVPQEWWLSALVSPLADDVCDVVTGYRWTIVARPTLGAHLVAAIDRTMAVLPRIAFTPVVWGGTLALSRRALARLDLPRTLADTLSDDCTIGARAAALGLRILTRRALLVPTPLGIGVAAAWQFGRRQYQIVRIYRPELFALGLAAISARLLAWGVILANLAASSWPAVAGGAFIVLALGALAAQQAIAHRLGFADPPRVAAVQTLLAVAKPLVDLFHWSMIAAALGTRIRWAHVTYAVGADSRVAVAERTPWPSSSP